MSDRILLVDDHEVILEGIRALVERSGKDWEVCGVARNGGEAVEMARALDPDVVVLDISMPVMNGIDAAKAILKANKTSKILLFTMHDSERMVKEAQGAGARGYVIKSQAARNLVRAIEAVLAGKTFFGAVAEPDASQNKPNKKKTGDGPKYFTLICA
ncbi:MAG: response regulator [Candidatus Acidiferrales bacterium]